MLSIALYVVSGCVQGAEDSATDIGAPTTEGEVVTIAPAPENPTLLINEILPDFARSGSGDLANSGDWLELVNIGAEPIPWAELYFEVGSSINVSGFGEQACTAGTIEPGAHPVITAGHNQTGLGDCVILSPLEISEETIILWQLQTTENGTVATPVNAVRWTNPIALPYSVARIPDGSKSFTLEAVPTPGWANDK